MFKRLIIGIVIGVVLVLGVLGYFGMTNGDNSVDVNTDEGSEGSVNGVPVEGAIEDGGEGVVGPGGCIGSACNAYCSNNPVSCDQWCEENSDICEEVMASWGDDFGENQQEGEDNGRPPEGEGRQGDGVWEKKELKFYIRDLEGKLTDEKRGIIQGTVSSTVKSEGGWMGWNSALEELNSLYPDNIVPDKLVETGSESEADIIIGVHSAKEFCCDLSGEPITGVERSTIGNNDVKLLSKVDAYNIVNIDNGFLGDMMRHELGHTLGIFGHVVDRQNDLMSVFSPASAIKKGNLDDLYVKYRDRDIQTVDEARDRDQR